MRYTHKGLFSNSREETFFLTCFATTDEQKQLFGRAISYLSGEQNKKNSQISTLLSNDQEDTVPALLPLLHHQEVDLQGCLFFLVGSRLLAEEKYTQAFNKLFYALTLPGIHTALSGLLISRLAALSQAENQFSRSIALSYRLLALCDEQKALRPFTNLALASQIRCLLLAGDIPAAEHLLTKITQTAESLLEPEQHILLQAAIYRSRKEYQQALTLLEQITPDANQPAHLRSEFFYLSATCRLALEDLSGAKKALETGWHALSECTGTRKKNTGNYENLWGIWASKQKQPLGVQAEQHFQNALTLFRETNDQRNLARVKRNLGKLCFSQQQYQQANQYLCQAVGHDSSIRHYPGIAQTRLIKAAMATQLGQYQQVQQEMSHIKALPLPGLHWLPKALQALTEKLEEGKPERLTTTALKPILHTMQQIAQQQTADTVTLIGEPGTGKQTCAHLLHQMSGRQRKPFIAIDLAAIPPEQLAEELFGSADKGEGRLAAAKGGTVYLHDCSLLANLDQTTLKAFLQDRRLINETGISNPFDLLVICGSSKELAEAIPAEQTNILTAQVLYLPALAERGSDFFSLVSNYYLTKSQKQHPFPAGFSANALLFMKNEVQWPDNIDGLHTVIDRCMSQVPADKLIERSAVEDALFYIRKQGAYKKPSATPELTETLVGQLVEIKQELARLQISTEPKAATPQKQVCAASKRIDRSAALESLFLFFQEQQKPVQRREVKECLPQYSKSVNKWLNILMHEYQVIVASNAAENQQNRSYSLSAKEQLERLLAEKKIYQLENGFYSLGLPISSSDSKAG